MRLARAQRRRPPRAGEPRGTRRGPLSARWDRNGPARSRRVEVGSTALISCRTNLSPFTKDCRVLRASNVSFLIFARSVPPTTVERSPEPRSRRAPRRIRTRADTKKGCDERIAPRCTLSQNGYGNYLGFEVAWADDCSPTAAAGARHRPVLVGCS